MSARRERIGVVAVTRDRRASLLRTLAELGALPERPPIVVIDNGSKDGTGAAVAREHPHVRLVALDHDAGAAARTRGVRLLETECVAFSDDDSWWAAGSLARAAALFDAHPRLGLIAARILVGPERRLDPTCAEMTRSPLPTSAGLPGPPILGFVACGAIVRRRAYLAAGGFEPRFGFGGEEQLLALDLSAAGWELAYVETIVAHHHPWPDKAGRQGRRSRELRNLIWTAWLRRPPGVALAESAALATAAVGEGRARSVLEAARGLPWVLRSRRRLPEEVERAARLLWGTRGALEGSDR
jgi:GT2 family glycosyltransferase